MICDRVGKKQTAAYELYGSWFKKIVTVGDITNRCIGRCGLGCGAWGTTYTQECLDHDLCHRETGENLGVCSKYFIRAISGFVFAPGCF